MSSSAKNTMATVIPCLRYRDGVAAIEWLCRVFGFEKHAVYTNADGSIAHAELSYGHGLIMIGGIVDNEYGKFIRQPDELGGVETQTIYLIVNSADEIYAQAKAAGAEMLIDIKDESYGGRGFTCRDLEGRLWSIGTYDPWAAAT